MLSLWQHLSQNIRVFYVWWQTSKFSDYSLQELSKSSRILEKESSQVKGASTLFWFSSTILSMLFRKCCRVFNLRPYQWWRQSAQKTAASGRYSSLPYQGKFSKWISGALSKLQQLLRFPWVLPASDSTGSTNSQETDVVLYHYCIIRADLPAGVLAAQLVHAAGESVQGSLVPPNTHAVVLAVGNETELLAVEAKLLHHNIELSAIREPDAPWCGQLMAIGCRPQERKKLRKLLGNLPLYK